MIINKKKALLLIIFFSSIVSYRPYAYALEELLLKHIDNSYHKVPEYTHQGKWLVLNIWGTRCPPCQEEVPELVNFHDTHHDKDAIVLGIAIDFPGYGYANQAEVVRFSQNYLIDFPILLSDSTVTERLGLGALQGLPTTYLFNPDGKLVGIQTGGITEKILDDFIHHFKSQNPE